MPNGKSGAPNFVPQDPVVARLYAALRCRFGEPWCAAYDNTAAAIEWSAALRFINAAQIRRMVRKCVDQQGADLPTPANFISDYGGEKNREKRSHVLGRPPVNPPLNQIDRAIGSARIAELRQRVMAGVSG